MEWAFVLASLFGASMQTMGVRHEEDRVNIDTITVPFMNVMGVCRPG